MIVAQSSAFADRQYTITERISIDRKAFYCGEYKVEDEAGEALYQCALLSFPKALEWALR